MGSTRMNPESELDLRGTTVVAFAVALITICRCSSPSVVEVRPSLDQQDLGIPLVSNWQNSLERRWFREFNVRFTDQTGDEGRLIQLIDRPTLITFFYTRCQNNYKCSATISQFAALQSRIVIDGLEESVRLLAITFEPHFDTSERVQRYGRNRGVRFNANVRALVLEPEGHTKLIDALKTPVGFNSGWVNTHGVALDLFDAQARFVRRYHTLVWDNDAVVRDIHRLLQE